jgi:hypothetical protein
MRILFITKRNSYGYPYGTRNSGLYNSVRFVVQELCELGFETEIAVVTDNNDIDREVTRFRPDKVVIEALWVVPEKFDVLKALHPSVRWYCHLHSALPFLAQEGIAIRWIIEYVARGVGFLVNSEDVFEGLSVLIPGDVTYVPNVYAFTEMPAKVIDRRKDSIDVGCFGAVRPLKNQLMQALAAIDFANVREKYLRFHINADRVETGGEEVLKNLRALFALSPAHTLVEHPWLEPREFIALCRSMDIGLQVSLAETFNIVSADYVAAGIPMVVSREVVWASSWSQADFTVSDIVKTMGEVWGNRVLVWWDRECLRDFSREALAYWKVWASE